MQFKQFNKHRTRHYRYLMFRKNGLGNGYTFVCIIRSMTELCTEFTRCSHIFNHLTKISVQGNTGEQYIDAYLFPIREREDGKQALERASGEMQQFFNWISNKDQEDAPVFITNPDNNDVYFINRQDIMLLCRTLL